MESLTTLANLASLSSLNYLKSDLNNSLIEIKQKLESTQELFINDLSTQQALTLESNWLNGGYIGGNLAVFPGQIFVDANYYYLIGLDFKPIRLLKDSRLVSIENKVNQLLNNSSPQKITLTPLVLNPTYGSYSPNAWQTAPVNLTSIYDNDESTASNLYEISGSPWNYGSVTLSSGITIPARTQVNMKIGMQQIHGGRGIWELAAFKLNINDWVNVWSYNGTAPNNSDLIANISVPIFFQWDRLKLTNWDLGIAATRARIYDLKVWEVS